MSVIQGGHISSHGSRAKGFPIPGNTWVEVKVSDHDLQRLIVRYVHWEYGWMEDSAFNQEEVPGAFGESSSNDGPLVDPAIISQPIHPNNEAPAGTEASDSARSRQA